MTGLILSLVWLWVLLAAVWVAIWPLFDRSVARRSDADVERQELEAEKARLLQEIHELELDYDTGKLSDEDHRAIEARLKGRAVEVMQQIDAAYDSVHTPQELGDSNVKSRTFPVDAEPALKRTLL